MSDDELRTDAPLRWSGTLQGKGARNAVRGDGPPAPPRWAANSVPEDGGVTHERVSSLHPIVGWRPGEGKPRLLCPADVSVNVVDRRLGRRWVRTSPTIHVEIGDYALADARLLVRAVQELITLAE